jgi:hypothetical protein
MTVVGEIRLEHVTPAKTGSHFAHPYPQAPLSLMLYWL